MNNHTKYKECPFCKSVLSYKAEKCDNCARDLDTSKQKKERIKHLKEIKFKIKKILKKTLLYFLIINIMVFSSAIVTQSAGKVHWKAKILMTASGTINFLYIYPIYNILGYPNVLAKPFYPLRNFLYNQGLKNLPEKDGEREIWWFIVKYSEYDKFIVRRISHIFDEKKPSNKEINNYINWTNEVYQHIYPLAYQDIKDEHFKSRRYGMLIDTVYEYDLGRVLLFDKIGNLQGNKRFYYQNNSEINRSKQLINLVIKRREYTRRFETSGYDHFYNETLRFYYDDLILHQLSFNVLINKMDNNNLNCSDKYIEIYGKARKNLREDIYDSRLPAKEKMEINIASVGAGPDQKKLYNLCPNNPHLDLLKKDIDFQSGRVRIRSEKDFVPPRL